jgi:hypothetical protein
MAIYMPPWLDRRPNYGPRSKVSPLARIGQIVVIAAAIGLVSFLAALITAIVTAGGG